MPSQQLFRVSDFLGWVGECAGDAGGGGFQSLQFKQHSAYHSHCDFTFSRIWEKRYISLSFHSFPSFS